MSRRKNNPDFPKTDFEFVRRFADDEEACWDYLMELRWPDGFTCPRCGMPDRNFLEDRGLFVCTLGHQTSITAGTVMHRSHLDLRYWFFAAWHIMTQTPGMSSVVLARKLGIKQESAYMMLQRLRAGMVAPDREPLTGTVEVDEAFINAGRERKVRHKRGRGAGQAVVACAVEIIGKRAGRVRLRAIPSADKENLFQFISDAVEKHSLVITDGLNIYKTLPDYGYKHHVVEGEDSVEVAKNLPQVHRVFANLKAWLIGTHHGVSAKHLQAYCNEFVFRYNRRGNPMAAFKALLGISSHVGGPEYEELYSVGEPEGWVHPNPSEEDYDDYDEEDNE